MITTAAKVYLWGNQIGAVAWDERQNVATFSYTKDFIGNPLSPSPIQMPNTQAGGNNFSFPSLRKDTFSGLSGMLADSLPDKFGSAMIDVWLAQSGRGVGNMNPIEKLLYIGSRGMGALEYRPASKAGQMKTHDVELDSLIGLANAIMQKKDKLDVHAQDKEALLSILQIGTSAGGARPKGIVAIHKDTNHIISGHTLIPKGYEHWIIKFDGVSDMELGEPQSYGRIEYAYYLMAQEAGINMAYSKLWKENGRAHFMTRRFDRDGNKKLHMQSLCGIAHYDFNMARAYSYEQAMLVAQRIGLPKSEVAQMYRRMVFNVIARNQDGHTKNIAFLMGEDGVWKLSPAYDVTYSHNPSGDWTNKHQMLVNNKSDDFDMLDILSVAKSLNIPHAKETIEQVQDAVANWSVYAEQAGLNTIQAKGVAAAFRDI